MKRRQLLPLPVLMPMASLLPLLSSAARAAATPWPDKPLRMVVPFPAGSGPDLLSRRMAEPLGAALGQSVVVENKVGAGGAIGAELVSQAPADGYTLLLGASTHVTQKLISPQLKFDPLTQFEHVTRVAVSPSVLVVSASSPYRTVMDLVEAARKEPNKLVYASGGNGSAAHLAAAAMATAMKIDVRHVPYRGSTDILPALMNGDAQFGFPIAATALPLVTQGKLRALATTGAARLTQLPDLPTLKDALGHDELVLDAWSGIWVPARTPEPVLMRLNAALLKALADPGVREAFEKAGTQAAPTRTPAEFTRFVQAETVKYARLVIAARIGA